MFKIEIVLSTYTLKLEYQLNLHTGASLKHYQYFNEASPETSIP